MCSACVCDRAVSCVRSYIVFDTGSGTLASRPMFAALSRSIVSSLGATVTFDSGVEDPGFIVATQATVVGVDGSWAAALSDDDGRPWVSGSTATFTVDEDIVGDLEREHLHREVVAFVLFQGTSVDAPAPTPSPTPSSTEGAAPTPPPRCYSGGVVPGVKSEVRSLTSGSDWTSVSFVNR